MQGNRFSHNFQRNTFLLIFLFLYNETDAGLLIYQYVSLYIVVFGITKFIIVCYDIGWKLEYCLNLIMNAFLHDYIAAHFQKKVTKS